MAAAATSALAIFPRSELKTIGLVSTAHAFSHFYMLVLPPLFPLLHRDLALDYGALGLLLTAYAIATGIMQVPMGMLVDRLGGRATLSIGLALNGLAVALIGLVPGYWAMFGFMLLAGAGNSVFHPADYAILSARVADGRAGRAFSVHLFAGYIGWMLAPPAVLGLTALAGWRAALLVLGLVGIGFAVVLLGQREALSDADQRRQARRAAADAKASGGKTGLALLLTPVMAALFLFYVIVSMAGHGIQSFSVVALVELHHLTLGEASSALTAYFLAAAGGTLAGGWLADKVTRRELATAISFIISAAFIAALGLRALSLPGVMSLMFLGGFFLAVVAPLRDLMVRRAAPAGSVGTAFGSVTTGFGLGLAISPALMGWLIDQGEPQRIFYATAAVTLLGLVTLLGARLASSAQAARQPREAAAG